MVEIRRLPPGLTVLLVPYLALMARHWIGCLHQRGRNEPVMPRHDEAGSPPDDESDENAEFLGSGGCSSDDDSPQPTMSPPTEGPAPPPSRRGRARRRPRAPNAEPSAASGVQVRPGRFLRVEEMAPEHSADITDGDGRPDEAHGATTLDEVEAAPEALMATDMCAMVTDPEADDAGRDLSDAIIPEQPGEGSAGPAFPPGRRNVDARGNDAWNGSWIVQVPQGDLD